MNEDLEQLRILNSRQSAHQSVALQVIAADDAFFDALFRSGGDLTALMDACKARRRELDDIVRQRPIG